MSLPRIGLAVTPVAAMVTDRYGVGFCVLVGAIYVLIISVPTYTWTPARSRKVLGGTGFWAKPIIEKKDRPNSPRFMTACPAPNDLFSTFLESSGPKAPGASVR